MHELSIATALIGQVLDLAQANGLTTVSRVEVAVGTRRMVVHESLEMAFEAVSVGTIAEHARVVLTEEAMAATCRACGHAYAPTLRDFRCPSCRKADPELTAGSDIRITSITGDAPDEAPHG
jgi:hydrogenase nickel incorporation protein HypA/HybF